MCFVVPSQDGDKEGPTLAFTSHNSLYCWCPSVGREAREAGGTAAESLIGRRSTRKRTMARSIGRVSTRFGEGGGQLDLRRTRRVTGPGARESKTRTGRFLGRKLIFDHDLLFSPRRPNKERRTGKTPGLERFSGVHRAVDG